MKSLFDAIFLKGPYSRMAKPRREVDLAKLEIDMVEFDNL